MEMIENLKIKRIVEVVTFCLITCCAVPVNGSEASMRDAALEVESVETEPPIFQFGCKFSDNLYNYPNSDASPSFGTSEIKVLKFDQVDDLLQTYDDLVDLYKRFLSEENYNTVDYLIDFYQHFRLFGKLAKSFDQLYDEYYAALPTRLYDDYDASGLAVAWLHNLTQAWPRMSELWKHKVEGDLTECVYLAAADVQPSLGKQKVEEQPNHVAAFVKFEVKIPAKPTADSSSAESTLDTFTETGYFLFDPGFALKKPILAIKNGLIIKDKYFLSKYPGINIGFTNFWNDIPQEILFKVTDTSIVGDLISRKLVRGEFPEPTEHSNHVVYNVEKPFCSFVKSIMKPSLFNPKRMIVRRNLKGDVKAALSVVIYPTNQNATIKLAYYKILRHTNNLHLLEIPVNEVESLMKRWLTLAFINVVCKEFGYTEDALKLKIIFLAEILKDEEFLRGIQEMGAHFDLDTERGDFWDSRPEMYATYKVDNQVMYMKPINYFYRFLWYKWLETF